MQVLISFGFLSEIFKFDGSHIPRFKGLPRTAELLRVELHDNSPLLRLVFRHDSFDIVSEGDYIPTLRIEGSIVWPCEGCLAEWDRMDNAY